MKKVALMKFVLFALAAHSLPALADHRYDEICVSSANSRVFYNYSNLYLVDSYAGNDYENPVHHVTSFDLTGSKISASSVLKDLENKKLNIYGVSKISQRTLFIAAAPAGGEITVNADIVNARVESSGARLTVTVAEKTVLSVPLINVESRDEKVSLHQKGMIFNGKPVSAVTYQYCGQSAD